MAGRPGSGPRTMHSESLLRLQYFWLEGSASLSTALYTGAVRWSLGLTANPTAGLDKHTNLLSWLLDCSKVGILSKGIPTIDTVVY